MRTPTASNDGCGNELRQADSGVAAHWLQSNDVDGREASSNDAEKCVECNASIRYIATAWPHLKPHIREAIFTLIDAAIVDAGDQGREA